MDKSLSILDRLERGPLDQGDDYWRARGWIPLGYCCSLVPEVILSLGRLYPFRLRVEGTHDMYRAEGELSPVICSYIKAIYEAAVEGRFAGLGGWVLTSGCDHMRRLYDVLKYRLAPRFIHFLDVPHRRSEQSIAFLAEELRELAHRLEEHFQVDASQAALAEAISAHNRVCELMQQLQEMKKKGPPVFSGVLFHHLVQTINNVPLPRKIELLEETIGELGRVSRPQSGTVRLLVVGSILDETAIIKMVEESGGVVVGDRFCSGSIPAFTPIEEESSPAAAGDPWSLLARHTFSKSPCPRMMDSFPERLGVIEGLIREYRIDGVIVTPLKSCDLWGIEASLLVQALKRNDVPVLRLEHQYVLHDEMRVRTRIESFLEMFR